MNVPVPAQKAPVSSGFCPRRCVPRQATWAPGPPQWPRGRRGVRAPRAPACASDPESCGAPAGSNRPRARAIRSHDPPPSAHERPGQRPVPCMRRYWHRTLPQCAGAGCGRRTLGESRMLPQALRPRLGTRSVAACAHCRGLHHDPVAACSLTAAGRHARLTPLQQSSCQCSAPASGSSAQTTEHHAAVYSSGLPGASRSSGDSAGVSPLNRH